jgi:hypothetical protein
LDRVRVEFQERFNLFPDAKDSKKSIYIVQADLIWFQLVWLMSCGWPGDKRKSKSCRNRSGNLCVGISQGVFSKNGVYPQDLPKLPYW